MNEPLTHRAAWPLELSAVGQQRLLDQGLVLPATLDKAVLKRRVEYLAGRYAARAALASAGLPAQVPGSGSGGEPLWPAGVCGSISHGAGQAVARVTRAPVRGLGVDREAWLTPLRAARVVSAVAQPAERALRPRALSEAEFVTRLFSAKETLFKALYPSVRRYLGFATSTLVEIDAAGCRLGFTLAPTLQQSVQAPALWWVQAAADADGIECWTWLP
ncbi:4'-phosphopantetheinyl transferase family protein [Isoalcanivorax beigongshangi]|uniref:Enterobactin synthase component D n=1 Tax=Isoalcanivorax beigongshangi TaxID=3238810 RepID=A0ABV4AJ65_9GAMM